MSLTSVVAKMARTGTAKKGKQKKERKFSIPAWGWLVLVALVIRLVNLGHESLWYDETFTSAIAKLQGANFWAALVGDVHPPLHYLISGWFINTFGNSEFVLRLPPALFGTACVFMMYTLASELFDKKTALIVGALTCIHPALLYYSQDARMYPMLTFFVLVMLNSAIRGKMIGFAIGAIGTTYSQNLGVFYVAAIGGITLLLSMRSVRSFVFSVTALTTTVVAWSPWAIQMIKQTKDIADGFWLQPLSFGTAILPIAVDTLGLRIPPPLQFGVYAGAYGLTFIGLIVSRKWLFTRKGLIVLAAIFGAPILIALVSVFWHSVYLARAILPSGVLIMLLWGYLVMKLSPFNRLAARAVLIFVVSAGVVFHYFPPGRLGREDIKAWVEPVRDGWRSGDVVFFTAVHSTILSEYYLDDRPYYLRPYASDLNQSLSEQTKHAFNFYELDFDSLKGAGYKRAWVLVYINPLSTDSEKNELERITTTYKSELIEEDKQEYAIKAIYLISL